MTDGLPERLFPQQVADHVQYPASLVVQMPVEQVDGLVVPPAHDGTLVAAGLAEIGLRVRQQLHVRLVAPFGVFAPDVLEVGGETLVQPGLGPLPAGEQIAPPLVGQLVRDQPIDVVVQGRALVQQHLIGQGGGAGVLHAAEDEIGHGDLAVAAVGVGDADALERSGQSSARCGRSCDGRLPRGPGVRTRTRPRRSRARGRRSSTKGPHTMVTR